MAEPDPPDRLPIFPLPDVVLFPGAYLPLHIFEPRYRAMTAAALAGEQLIGMIVIRPGGDMMLERAPIFTIGCAGRIIDAQQLADGRFNLVLRGIRSFRTVDEELAAGGYRLARVDWLADTDFEDLDAELREHMRASCELLQKNMLKLTQLTAPQGIEVVRRRMRELDPMSLVHAISFGLDCNPLEKQSLLECADPLARLELLLGLIELRTAELRLPAASQTLN